MRKIDKKRLLIGNASFLKLPYIVEEVAVVFIEAVLHDLFFLRAVPAHEIVAGFSIIRSHKTRLSVIADGCHIERLFPHNKFFFRCRSLFFQLVRTLSAFDRLLGYLLRCTRFAVVGVIFRPPPPHISLHEINRTAVY